MTSTRSPLTVLGDHLAQLFRTDAGSRAMTLLIDAGLGVDQSRDLIALLGHQRRVVGRIRRVRLVEFLAGLAPADEVAALCVVVSLRPELTWMTRASTRDLAGPEEAEGDAVAIAWEVVAKGSGDAGRVSHPVLVNAIWSEICRSAGLRRGRLDTVPLAHDFDQSVPTDDHLERWPGLLGSAVARGVLTPRQVVVIGQTRLEGQSLRTVAATLGRTYDSLRMERTRAEAALRQFALSYFEAEGQ